MQNVLRSFLGAILKSKKGQWIGDILDTSLQRPATDFVGARAPSCIGAATQRKVSSHTKQNMRKASAKNNNNDTCKPCWLSLETCCDDVNSLQNAIHGRGRKEMRIEHHLIMQIDVGWVVSLAGGLAGG